MENNKLTKKDKLSIYDRYIRSLRELAYLNRIYSKLKKYN